MKSQDVVAMRLRRLARDRGDSLRLHGVASAGQHAADLEVSYAGIRLFVEVKGLRRLDSEVVLLERSVRRRTVPADIEKVLAAVVRHSSLGGARIDSLVKSTGVKPDFLGVLDFFRKHVDPEIGLSEDAWSPASGKLPKELQTTSRAATAIVRSVVVESMKTAGNSYLAVHDKSTDDVHVYHTGYGRNPLRADPVPAFTRVKLDTYGGSSKGATRVAVKSLVAFG